MVERGTISASLNISADSHMKLQMNVVVMFFNTQWKLEVITAKQFRYAQVLFEKKHRRRFFF